MQLEVTERELEHIRESINVALAQFEAVACWGSKEFDETIFELKTLRVKVLGALKDLEYGVDTTSATQ